MTNSDLEAKAINVIRALGMDGPHAANSGHQGTAMALAPAAHVLWTRIMNFDASNPEWPDRDRFILSPGHASILLYAGLHLLGYGLTLDDLKAFRQWGSATPGHPEVGHTAGVEVTTGPLGQGFANSVGMAIAEARLRATFGPDLCNHRIYGFCSDGDLQEGISHEAASWAGHLGLGRINFIYDDNHVSIDGPTELTLSDDTPKRFESYGWHVQDLGEAGEDLDAIENALRTAAAVEDAPSLIVVRTHIAHPSPSLTDNPEAHGLAFDDATIAEAKAVMGLPDEPFHVPDDVLEYYRSAGVRGAARRNDWNDRLAATDETVRKVWQITQDMTGEDGWEGALPTYAAGESVATRKAIGACLNALLPAVPSLVAGGADLSGNTGTKLADTAAFSGATPEGRQLFFGIREHAMGAAMVGMALHGGCLPAGGTFLAFSDYMRGAVRLAALSKAKVGFVWTHDSVGVGEDGPTHQPVEQVAALRAIPDLPVFRGADANEVVHGARAFVAGDGPMAFILSRQGVPVLEGTADAFDDVVRGGYVVADAPEAVATLVAAGSEVSLCIAAAEELAASGEPVRVVSMPCMEWFADQDDSYRNSVIDRTKPVLAVEAGVAQGWYRWADDVVSIDRFGASAPGSTVMSELGLNPGNVAGRLRALL
jgi:transketolase